MSSLLRVKCGAEMNTCFGGLQNQQDRAWLGSLGGKKNPGKGKTRLGSKALFKLFANVFSYLCIQVALI